VFRLVGEPGVGKSMISTFLVAELDKNTQKSGNTIFAYYFFDNKVGNRRTASVLLRTLLLQFLEQVPSLFKVIAPDYRKMGQKLMEDFDALWRILVLMLQHLLQTDRVWIVIDAVDECGEDRTPLLESLRDFFT
jgi:predicted NACHT family NTPase